MNKIPLTFCLFTSTLGHFGIKTRYLETLDSFSKACPFNEYEGLIAHIKMTPGDESIAEEMTKNLRARGFTVLVTEGKWSHFAESHQLGYLSDMLKVYTHVRTPYVLAVEDDWLVVNGHGEFIDNIQFALTHLENEPDLMQVRIPRFNNEQDRIGGLMAKHGINGITASAGDHFRHNDFSANPAFYRTRDIRAALLLTFRSSLPKHAEHGLGQALKFFSESDMPFACYQPGRVRICHIGAPVGEEDDINKLTIAT